MNEVPNFDGEVRLAVYQLLVKTARAPTVVQVAERIHADVSDVEDAFRRLAEQHTLVLRPNSVEILMAHPLSAVPSGYETHVGGMTYWPNCGWDSLGVAAMIGEPATVTFACPDCQKPIELNITDDGPDADALRVHFAVPARHWWDDITFT